MFYFGYLAWSWPSSYLLVRLPIAKYLSVSVLIWGGVLMCHAASKNFGGLMATRFFLVSLLVSSYRAWPLLNGSRALEKLRLRQGSL